ncbi:ParB family chromosome partitioning protein [Rhizobium petrolearium]|uniref:ParB/RepB/Spo0J family partition protein n=2 Tax=Neorhizobium TaxID=1525371 RepID=A0ABV0MCI4_9HYPH|nr:ParB/RepB/Spo0J family partition protein [Neorhizobium petrolearium]MBP1848322.1 ParB family chromosome partitioning protein [Neorhizobium petrolearium]MCC2614542.1 ParB/RepB/Spo0J family partition protein [Neorhizobium petrolearium]WGI72301.1 ParB/RepB/Spo0J family partition protein [Neorhizobium petrolearium]
MTNNQAATETFFAPLNKLDRDPKNVRKTYSKEGIAEMAATIRADGYRLLHNLIVRKGDKRGRFFVTAGGRRLAALSLLAEAGEIAKDYLVECKERNEAEATEISLIENTSVEAMHPADEYEAFRVMADGGKTVEDIAARFGTSETKVRKRLALARVSPVLLDLYRNEEMSFEQLSAFTVSDDHAKQVEVWNSLPSWNRDRRSIRSALQSDAITASDKRIKFIGGIDVYEAAGGTVKRDLFDERNSGYALDVGLVEKLMADKLEAEAEKIRAEGWKWVECVSELPREAHYMSRLYPASVPITDEQQAELDRLEEEYAEIEEMIEAGVADDEAEPRAEAIQARMAALMEPSEAYDPDGLAMAGCYVLMDYYGNLSVERGLIRIEDEPDEADDEAEGADSIDEPVTRQDEEKQEPVFSLSAAMVQELTAQKTAIIRAELAHNPEVALAAVVHAMLTDLFNSYGSNDETCLEVKVKSERLETSIKDPAACKGIAAMDDLKENYGHTVPGNPRHLWDWCLEQPTATLLDLLAYAAARSVNALQLPHFERKVQRAHAERLARALKIDMTLWFEPTADNYFGRISKTGMVQAVTEAKGADFASGISGMKKADAAAFAERQVAGTGWLPALLRIEPVSESGEVGLSYPEGDDCPFDVDEQPDIENDDFSDAAE